MAPKAYRRFSLSTLLSLATTSTPLAWAVVGPPFYVKPVPGPNPDCSFGNACSLETARNAARVVDMSISGDIHIYLLDGIYERSRPFTLSAPRDSGRAGHKIYYEAYPGAIPRLSGGTQITPWSQYQPGLWRAEVASDFKTRNLFVNAIRAERVRGAFKPAYAVTSNGYSDPAATMAGWRNPQDIEVVAFNEWKAFRCRVDHFTGASIVMDPTCWCRGHYGHVDVNGNPDRPIREATWFENAYELLMSPTGREGNWYHDRSVAPDGKFYLYYRPRNGEILDQPLNTLVIAPKLESLLIGTGSPSQPLENLVIRGIYFLNTTSSVPSQSGGYPSLIFGSYFTSVQVCTGDTPPFGAIAFIPAAVSFTKASNVTVDRSVFARLGATALEFKGGSKNNLIEGNLFRDIGGSAIRIGDPQPAIADLTTVAENNVISDNYVTEVGRDYFDAQAINVQHARGTTVEHNEVHNVPYTGIGAGWPSNSDAAQDNLIQGNRVHNALQRLRDGSTLYVLAHQPDSLVLNNYAHDTIYRPYPYLPPLGPPTLFAPMYVDFGTIFTTISNNVFASAPRSMFWNMCPTLEPPHDNVVTNTYTDIGSYECYCGACANNSIQPPVVFPVGQWPPAAATIMNTAGPDGSFAALFPKQFRIEAEDFIGGAEVGYHDVTATNGPGGYRPSTTEVPVGPDIFQTWGIDVSAAQTKIIGASNDYMIGYIQNGEWLRYYIDVPTVTGAPNPNTYTFSLWGRSGTTTNTVHIQVDLESPHVITLPNTTATNPTNTALWKIAIPGVFPMTAGPHTITIAFFSPAYDSLLAFDAFTYTRP